MWDKSIDEGIFLCEHESHILTADFLESLYYVNEQRDVPFWKEPGEFLMNEIDFISYILLKNSEELQTLIFCISEYITVSNKKNNELIQGNLQKDNWEDQPFIYKLFDKSAKFDSVCARCGDYIHVWDDFCRKCTYYDDDYDQSYMLPRIGTINCHACEGFYFRFNGKPVTYYCEYNKITKYRSPNACEECNEHFDYWENRQ